MRLKLYAVLDKAAEVYLPPFTARADGEASRIFANALADSRSQLAGKTLDVSLFRIGEFDDSTGVGEFDNAPKLLLTGLNAMGILQREHDQIQKEKGGQ